MTDPIQYLRNFLELNSFKALSDMFGINARPSKDFSKWSLNYDQIASKAGCQVAGVCRGLVIRPKNKVTDENQVVGRFHIVARPMDRFYNANDSHAAPIDWSTARIQEKLDGTMCILYWDDVKNEWCVATRSVPEADVSFGDFPGSPLRENTFKELFRYTVEQMMPAFGWKRYCDGLDKTLTFIFELTTPLNRVVVKYADYGLTLLCVRDTLTGGYISEDTIATNCPTWPLQSLSDLTDFVNTMDPAKCEGAVVVDANWNRVKVKSKAWVLASRAKDAVTMSKRNALECIILGQADDVIPLLDPYVGEYITQLQDSLKMYCIGLDASLSSLKDLYTTRKDFALAVQSSGQWQTPFFALYNKEQKSLDWLRELSKTGKLTNTTLDTLLSKIDV